jgi:hypothetical protein
MLSKPAREVRAFDRKGLEGLVDQYLDALVKHSPKGLPLAKDVRYTELGQEMELGDGFWGTVTGRGNYKQIFADPEFGGVGGFVTMQEGGRPLLMALRLKLQLGLITEVETAYYRQMGFGGGANWNDLGPPALDKQGKPLEPWSRATPPAQRLPRQQLINIANCYFAGLENNDGKGYYPFTDDCHRLENGVATSNNPDLKMGGPNSDFNPAAMSVKAAFETGFYGVVTRIHDRRFPLVDEERSIVLAFTVFDHAGTKLTVRLTDGRDYPMAMFNRPSSLYIAEAFKIENGLISQIEALCASVPYHSRTGWPGGISGS